MVVSRQTKKAWGTKLEKLAEEAERAQENLLVGIFQAREAGLSQADVAYSVGGISPSGVKAKEIKGREILERRRKGADAP